MMMCGCMGLGEKVFFCFLRLLLGSAPVCTGTQAIASQEQKNTSARSCEILDPHLHVPAFAHLVHDTLSHSLTHSHTDCGERTHTYHDVTWGMASSAVAQNVSHRRTVALLNEFVTHTGEFLNRFSRICEEKLHAVGQKLQRLDVTVCLLEAKLNSIEGLESGPPAPRPQAQAQTQPQAQAPAAAEGSSSAPPQAAAAAAAVDEEIAAAPAQDPNVETCEKNPILSRFFKMLGYGIPAPGVKQKMMAEGFNPDLLDTPNAPVPPEILAMGAGGGGAGDGDSTDSSDFSDSD